MIMDEIKNLQNKYSSITITQLEEIMNKRGKKINQVIHEQDQQLKGKCYLFKDFFFLFFKYFFPILVFFLFRK